MLVLFLTWPSCMKYTWCDEEEHGDDDVDDGGDYDYE